MSLISKIQALYRGDPVDLQATRQRGLLVGQGLPPYAHLAAGGGGYSVIATAGVATIVVAPTVLSLGTLFNNAPGGGKTFVLDRAFFHQLVSTAAEARLGIWLCVHPVGMAKPTADITKINSGSGRKGYGGDAIFDLDATVVDDGWYPWGDSVDVEPTGTLPGAQVAVPVGGRILVPPQAGVSIQVVSSLAGVTGAAGLSWFEEQLDVVA